MSRYRLRPEWWSTESAGTLRNSSVFPLRLLLIPDSGGPETLSRVHRVPLRLPEWNLFGSTEKPLPPKGRSVATPFGIADTGLILARPAADGMHQRPHLSTPPDQDHNRNDFDRGRKLTSAHRSSDWSRSSMPFLSVGPAESLASAMSASVKAAHPYARSTWRTIQHLGTNTRSSCSGIPVPAWAFLDCRRNGQAPLSEVGDVRFAP